MKVLIVEDNFELANIYRAVLNKNNIIADIVLNTNQFHQKELNQYDMVLLDVNLPDGDGISILKEIRNKNKLISIIMISARSESEIVIEGLNSGADDYLRKPIDFEELIARINMVYRRKNIEKPNIFELENLLVDFDKKIVMIDEQILNLTQKQYLIFEKLVKGYPGFITSEELINAVYDEYVDEGTSSLRVHVYNLKKKLANHYPNDIIVSEKSKGYSLCLPVNEKN